MLQLKLLIKILKENYFNLYDVLKFMLQLKLLIKILREN